MEYFIGLTICVCVPLFITFIFNNSYYLEEDLNDFFKFINEETLQAKISKKIVQSICLFIMIILVKYVLERYVFWG